MRFLTLKTPQTYELDRNNRAIAGKAKLVLFSVGEDGDLYIGMLHHGKFQILGLGRPEPITDMNVTHWMPLPDPPTPTAPIHHDSHYGC